MARLPRVKVSFLKLTQIADIKIFLGEDEEDEVIDEEMDGLETEGDIA